MGSIARRARWLGRLLLPSAGGVRAFRGELPRGSAGCGSTRAQGQPGEEAAVSCGGGTLMPRGLSAWRVQLAPQRGGCDCRDTEDGASRQDASRRGFFRPGSHEFLKSFHAIVEKTSEDLLREYL